MVDDLFMKSHIIPNIISKIRISLISFLIVSGLLFHSYTLADGTDGRGSPHHDRTSILDCLPPGGQFDKLDPSRSYHRTQACSPARGNLAKTRPAGWPVTPGFYQTPVVNEKLFKKKLQSFLGDTALHRTLLGLERDLFQSSDFGDNVTQSAESKAIIELGSRLRNMIAAIKKRTTELKLLKINEDSYNHYGTIAYQLLNVRHLLQELELAKSALFSNNPKDRRKLQTLFERKIPFFKVALKVDDLLSQYESFHCASMVMLQGIANLDHDRSLSDRLRTATPTQRLKLLQDTKQNLKQDSPRFLKTAVDAALQMEQVRDLVGPNNSLVRSIAKTSSSYKNSYKTIAKRKKALRTLSKQTFITFFDETDDRLRDQKQVGESSQITTMHLETVPIDNLSDIETFLEILAESDDEDRAKYKPLQSELDRHIQFAITLLKKVQASEKDPESEEDSLRSLANDTKLALLVSLQKDLKAAKPTANEQAARQLGKELLESYNKDIKTGKSSILSRFKRKRLKKALSKLSGELASELSIQSRDKRYSITTIRH